MGVEIEIEDNVILRDIRDGALARGRAEGLNEGRAEGRLEGRIEGRAEGRAELVLELLREKFGSAPAWAAARLNAASPSELDTWAKRALRADTIEAVFGLN